MNEILWILAISGLVACAPARGPRTPGPALTRHHTERPPVRSALTVETGEGMPALDRETLPESEDRWQSPEARLHHEEVMNRLWGTTLGQMYLAYLTDDVDNKIVPGRARQIIERIYADGEHVGKRLRLIEALTLDLYGRNKMSEDIVKRTVLFDRLAHAKETGNVEKNSDQMINLMIASGLASLPFGSPLVREEFGNLWSHSPRLCFWRSCSPRAIDWRRLLNAREVVRDFRPTAAVGTFLALGGGLSMMYSLGFEKLSGWEKSVTRDEEMLDGLEDLLEESDF